MKFIGLSLSFCVADMLDGKVAFDEVEKIIANTAARSEEDWQEVFSVYKRTYWQRCPGTGEFITRILLTLDRIVQPRLLGHPSHNIALGHWVAPVENEHGDTEYVFVQFA